MHQPDAQRSTIDALRSLVDDVGMRSYLVDVCGLHRSSVSRLLRTLRDAEALEPAVGLAEVVIRRARRAEEADGHRAGVEQLLSALAGEPVRLGLPEAAPVDCPGAPLATPAEVVARVASLVEEAAGMAAAVSRDAADGVLDAAEIERAMHRAADVQEHLRRALQALREVRP